MKKKLTVFFLLIFSSLIILCFVINAKFQDKKDYLRIHIVANSNFASDQEIKYKIKDSIVEFLTPIISNCESKDDFMNKLSKNLIYLQCISNEVLAQNSFDYKASVEFSNKYFPARSYDNLTLENGYYDALTINLGNAEGDNWWCVVYPPLCFANETNSIYYKSKFLEIVKKYFGG